MLDRTTTESDQGNPMISRIDGHWARIYPLLQALNGSRAREILEDVRKDDHKMFNALYWRVNEWMKSRLVTKRHKEARSGTIYVEEGIGSALLSAFVTRHARGNRIDGGWWETKHLPQLLAVIDNDSEA